MPRFHHTQSSKTLIKKYDRSVRGSQCSVQGWYNGKLRIHTLQLGGLERLVRFCESPLVQVSTLLLISFQSFNEILNPVVSSSVKWKLK